MTHPAVLSVAPAGLCSTSSQYLTFVLGEEQYGVPILKVQEIRGYSAITPIPTTPPYIKGAMNLRGTVIPVVDLRARFGMAAGEYNQFTVIIVVTVGEKSTGILVDAVSDVLDVGASDIRTAPELGVRVDTRFIHGLANIGEKLTVLLDIERLLTEEDAAALESLMQ